MLKSNPSAATELRGHGFLVAVDLEINREGIIEKLLNAIKDGVIAVKGVYTVDVEHLGEIEMIDDDGDEDVTVKES